MGTFSTEAVPLSGEEDEEGEEGCEVERLPPLLEDEENVSLADVLCLRDSCLSEQEVWAVCVECVRSLQSIAMSPLFHTLCITPDTLAFNAHGNVCFMEQLSDDPEGSFIPPEIDKTGSTFEGHVFSLGSTLSAALEYVIEPELEVELGVETRRLLEEMQEEKPENRPCPQDILIQVEDKLTGTTSTAVCRKLSAIGRRVLSIESVGNFQDEWEKTYHQFMKYKGSRANLVEYRTGDRLVNRHFSSDSYDEEEHLIKQRGRVCNGSFRSGSVDEYSSGSVLLRDTVCQSQNSSPVRKKNLERRSGRARSALNRSCSVPDSNNPPVFSPPSHTDISMMVADLSEIGEEERLGMHWEEHMLKEAQKKTAHDSDSEIKAEVFDHSEKVSSSSPPHISIDPDPDDPDPDPDDTGQGGAVGYLSSDVDVDVEEETESSNLCSLNHMTKSMLCLNEESQDEWVSLRELLSHYTRPLSVNELWALCYTCLSTLQTYIDFPAYLCLDSVYVGCEGEVLFLKPKNTGPYDAFYVAPEFQEHGIVTEKNSVECGVTVDGFTGRELFLMACIYGVAAILWATAKFHLSPNQKLAMPRKLKRLLLEMAKRTPIERPSIVLVKKTCRDYLSRQGTSAETVWIQLINRIHKAAGRTTDSEDLPDSSVFRNSASPEMKTGFVPLASDIKLDPVSGPVPKNNTVCLSRLPKAFTSSATHFTPIVLAQEQCPITEPATESIINETEITTEDMSAETPLLEENWEQNERDQQTNVNEDVPVHDYCPTSSSTNTPLTSPPHSSLQRDSQATNSQSLPNCSGLSTSAVTTTGVYNNYLLQQDPQTGLLTLFPVHIAVSQPITGLDLSLPHSSGSDANKNEECNLPCVTQNGESEHHVSSSYHRERNGNMPNSTESLQQAQVSSCTAGQRHVILQQIIGLIREEFAFDGYLENGVEELAMGEYILSLRSLQFETFCRAVVEKFSDLHWDTDLLELLHCLVNHSSYTLASSKQPPSKPEERALTSLLTARRHEAERERTERREHTQLDHNANVCHTAPLGPPEKKEQKEAIEQRRTELEDTRGHGGLEERSGEETTADERGNTWSLEGTHTKIQHDSAVSGISEVSGVKMETSSVPAEGADVPVCETEALCQSCELEESGESQLTHDWSDTEMEDSGSFISDRPMSSCSGLRGPSFSPTWALALYGEDCFSQDVVEYALKLGTHSDSPSLEEKSQEPPFINPEFYQELQQQLILESRNLKKTRNFYHKLIHQERKNKGSEAKVMLPKLKMQLEELKTKVEFLDSVKKYLQVLSVDQWGLPLPLLSSLATSGASAAELIPSEDPGVLSLVCEQRRRRGCCPLVAGTPKGLLAYLYASNAHLEGYIQHFLYTYRYFCTSEEFLQFLIDKFKSTVGQIEDPTTNSAKVYHRTLDLLECWIGNCQLVDMTSKSCLQQNLDHFLTTEVAPVDSRWENLLTVLQSTPNKKRSCGVPWVGGSTMSIWEDGDISSSISSLSGRSEDSAKKSFQWRISRVVEPQANQPKEKVYSIAAALPRPCYSSLVNQLTSSCLRTEERVAFSETEHTPLHTAQQLTLLQQELFQGCHPVHFLNSRAQGVREKAVNISKSVSSDAPPLEGSNLFVGEELAHDGTLQQLIRYADSVTNWVSAEIVITDSVKVQTSLLAKFLCIAKHCYETRNFATAMQVLGGLENVIVRQLPAWKQLSTKMLEVLEELRAVQVFLKSDSLCLMEGERGRGQPTLPDVHTLAMHVQQLEIGAFTLTSGAYKWPKLRSIARVVSQVHAFQERVYSYTPDPELQVYLQARITHLGACDVALLAADNDANFNQPAAERHTRRIQDTLRRVKASFQ
ncbi:kinase non-catalytic C-lobe domain-containing protein 1 isoform X2 [Astyanax mexicanus]|uniref:kinase non-catalytic C-lobe domain-containing protein 1 isoform X2 n=1 Tax=Astyanax mexicanus TaxID=7994 RepID=UPI0020CAE582|nr:kinase non-catalytic C-lobe domain-containing protein 1 isoform X2 [Astyanax mexicanus]